MLDTSITKKPKYAEIIQRWEAFWSLEDVGRPLWVFPTSPSLAPTMSEKTSLPQLFQDKDYQLNAELDILRWREAVDLNDDYVPSVQPQGGVTVFASAFGSEVQYFDHTLPWAHPVILPEDPAEKVYDMPEPAVTDGQLGQMLEFTDHFVTETGGRYPVAITDLQGPLDTAYLVWEPSAFMMAMYDHPQGSAPADAHGNRPDHSIREGAAVAVAGIRPVPLPAALAARRSRHLDQRRQPGGDQPEALRGVLPALHERAIGGVRRSDDPLLRKHHPPASRAGEGAQP